MWNILGIEPTCDIKSIKKAYAELAKQNNPEEVPEKFEQIHNAYKQAIEYARSHKDDKKTVDDDDLKTDVIITKSEVKNLYTVNAGTLEEVFCDIMRGKMIFLRNSKKSDAFDFNSVDVIRKKANRYGDINEIYNQMSSDVIKALEQIADDYDINSSMYIWNSFLNNPSVIKVLSDPANYNKIDAVVRKKHFTYKVASELCDKIGGKSRVVINTEFKDYDICYVDITGKRKLYYYYTGDKKRIANKVATSVLGIAAVLSFIVFAIEVFCII